MSGGGSRCVLVFLGHWGVGQLGTPGRARLHSEIKPGKGRGYSSSPDVAFK